jgi:hypothetical protein
MRLFGNAINNFYGQLNITVPSGITDGLTISSAAGIASFAEFAGNGNTLGTNSLAVGQGAGGASQILARGAQALNIGVNGGGQIALSSAGALTITDTTGTQWGAPSGGAQGSGTINAVGLFVGGSAAMTLAGNQVMSGATGGAQGAGTINAAGLFVNGAAVPTSANYNANNLTGTTLAAGVVNSSLTSVGTLAALTVSGTTTLGANSQAVTTGSFTITGTGFTSNPTGTATWIKIGNTVLLTIPTLTGTANATTFTLTGLPSAIQPATTNPQFISFTGVAGIASVYVLFAFGAGSGTVTLIQAATYAATSGAWASSGSRSLGAQTITYTVL